MHIQGIRGTVGEPRGTHGICAAPGKGRVREHGGESVGHRKDQSHLRGLWDTREAGKTQGFMRHTGGQVHLGQGWGHPRGLRGIHKRCRVAGSPQKLMPEPRPVAPPLLQALTEPPVSGRIQIPPCSPATSNLTGGARGCQQGARAARPGRRPARGGGAAGPGRRRGAGCPFPAGGRL